MKKLSLVIASLTALVSVPAFAADMAVKARPVPVVAPAPYNWTGFYIGFQSGGALGDADWSGNGTIPNGSLSHFIGGGIIGGTVGFNYQVASWVWGIEADYAAANIRGSINCPNIVFRCRTEIESFGTVRGRLGYAVGPMLFYATGGAAFGEVDVSAERLPGSTLFPGLEGRGEGNSQWGWTAGTGFEYAPLRSNLTWKIEWLYFNLDRDRYVIDSVGSVVDVRTTGHLIRTGLNYRFSWAPMAPAVVARY